MRFVDHNRRHSFVQSSFRFQSIQKRLLERLLCCAVKELWRTLITKSTLSLVNSKAVQFKEAISAIWSSIKLFKGEIIRTQVVADRSSCLAKAKMVYIMLFPKPVGSIAKTSFLDSNSFTAVSCSSFKIIFLVSLLILSVFKALSMLSILHC